MGARLPGHYNLNGGNGLIVGPLHDLNTVDSRSGDMDGMVPDRHQNSHPTDSLEPEDETDSVDCMPQTYGHSLQLQVGDDEDHSLVLDNQEPPRSPYGILTDADVLPIETARTRFLDLLLSQFITAHVISCCEVADTGCNSPNGKDKQKKRKAQDVQFEGDPKYVLPLAYVANLYETLISEINIRLATLDNVHEKTMGVALEAAGGLYRKLVKFYPKSGSTHIYKRREMASAVEARIKFPHLISGEEKRVRFVVVHGLEIIEHPNLSYEDAEWFKRLTGRHEAAISDRDYKFFSPRHKYRRTTHHSMANVPAFPAYNHAVSGTLTSSQSNRPIPQHQIQIQHSMECHQDHQSHPSSHQQQLPHLSHSQHTHVSHITDAIQSHHSSASPSQHITRGITPTSVHVGSRIVLMSARYCDECGCPYLRETSKFCSECGTKRVILTSS